MARGFGGRSHPTGQCNATGKNFLIPMFERGLAPQVNQRSPATPESNHQRETTPPVWGKKTFKINDDSFLMEDDGILEMDPSLYLSTPSNERVEMDQPLPVETGDRDRPLLMETGDKNSPLPMETENTPKSTNVADRLLGMRDFKRTCFSCESPVTHRFHIGMQRWKPSTKGPQNGCPLLWFLANRMNIQKQFEETSHEAELSYVSHLHSHYNTVVDQLAQKQDLLKTQWLISLAVQNACF